MTYTNNDVTIIIPVYNCQDYILESISSCIEQTDNIIVVNDGSTDNTKHLADYFTPEIKLINLEKNGGTAKALNEGIKASNTPFIKWLSADDVLKRNAINDMIWQVNKHCNINNRIFYTHYDIITAENEVIKTFTEPFITRENQKSVLLDRFYGNGSTSLIHKDVFDKVGLFNESLGYQEDYDFWLRAVCLHDVRLTLLPLNTIYYRIHDQQLTQKHKGESLKQSNRIRQNIYLQNPSLKTLSKPSIPFNTRMKRLARTLLYKRPR